MSRTFSDALDAIHEAVTATGRWGSALAAIAEFVGAPAGLLLLYDGEDRIVPLGVFGFDQARFCGDRDLRQLLRATEALAAGFAPTAMVHCVFARDPTAGEAAALASLVQERGLGAGLRVTVLREERPLASLWLVHESPEPFGGASCARLKKVLGHLQRALSIQSRVERIEGRAAASWQAFERVVLGAVVVDADARPLFVNRAAECMAAENDGFWISMDGLSGVSREATRALRAAIAEVVRGQAPEGLALSLPRSSGGRPYEVMVVPTRRSP